MKDLRKLLFYPLLLSLAWVSPALAQEISPVSQITERVDENSLVKLAGNTPPVISLNNDRGLVSANMPMPDLILLLRRSPERQAAFDAYVASQYDASSPNYHRWLEPAEVGERFGPSPTDIAVITSWLASHGLSVQAVSADRMTIRFSGQAGQVQSAFHTAIHNLVVNGEPYFSNISDPQIPMALAAVVAGPKALHNFVPRPMVKLGGKATRNEKTGRWERVPLTSPFELKAMPATQVARPELGINQGSGSGAYVIEDVTPYDFATIYNVLPLWSNAIDGTAQVIAIAGRSEVRPTDVASFRNIFQLPAGTFNIIRNGPSPGYCTGTTGLCTLMDQVENALDVEWAGATAKNATIDLVVTQQTATNDAVYESAQYVVANKIAPILSVSYGLCELALGTSGNLAYNTLWQTAAAEGIAVFVSSGDAGSPACDQGLGSTAPYAAVYGLSVNGLASTPFNTAVGGTDFTWCNPTGSMLCTSGYPYWAPTNDVSTGANALGYIGEIPWNDTCTSPPAIAYIKSVASATGLGNVVGAESACNFINNNYQTISLRYGIDLSFLVSVAGTGGGASSCTASDGSTTASCLGGYPKPGWQAGVPGIPNDGERDIPDLSFFGGAGFLNSAYIICVSDVGACLTTTSPVDLLTVQEVGGTSVGTPAMAGVMALINQRTRSAQGNPNAELYRLGSSQTYANCRSQGGSTSNGCYFNDIDSGTNAMPCVAGSPNCIVAGAANLIGVLSGHAATSGYDLATGLGTLNIANVVNAWPSSAAPATATVTVTPASSSIKADQSLSVSVRVQGSSGVPTGTVTLSGGGFTSSAQTLSSGSAAFVIPANSLSVGSDTLTASYSGDSTYSVASGTTVVTVTAGTKLTPTVTVTPASSSIVRNESLNVAVAVSGSGATPTGKVTLSAGAYTSPATTLIAGGGSFTIPANTLAPGAATLTVTYEGDALYVPRTSAALVTVSKISATLSISPDSGSIYAGRSFNVAVTVSGSAEMPTGTAVLSSDGYTSSEQALSAGQHTFAIPAGALSVGGHTLTVLYSGDGIYAAGSASAQIVVNASTFGMAASAPGAIARGASAVSVVTVSSNNGYAGIVALTCTLTASPAGATRLPTCAPDPTSSTVSLSASSASATGKVVVTTTAATYALLDHRMGVWAGSGAILAFLGIWVFPHRRRNWGTSLGVVILTGLLGCMAACGGGSTRSGGSGDPGTTAGTYTFTVTGTGNPTISPTPVATFQLTVN